MIKVHICPPRFEILFWDVIFWVMKILQRLRDRWIAFVYFIKPTIRYHLIFLMCVSAIGLLLGFAIGYFRVNLHGW
jgi:hypothetical protein